MSENEKHVPQTEPNPPQDLNLDDLDAVQGGCMRRKPFSDGSMSKADTVSDGGSITCGGTVMLSGGAITSCCASID